MDQSKLLNSVELMSHQKDGVAFALNNKGTCAFFHEVGCGKTLTALSTYAELKKEWPTLKLFVICPLSLIHGAWIREIKKFSNYTFLDLHDYTPEHFNSVDIVIVNFEYLVSEKKLCDLKKRLEHHGWLCVIDESSKLKNNRAKTVGRILSLRDFFKFRIVMSGTPAPNIEWEYWPQMYFLKDEILGNNFYKFKNTHFALSRGNQIAPGQFLNRAALRKMHEQGFTYTVIPAAREKMFKRMSAYCHYVKAKDCIDLPEELDEFRSIELTTEQKKIYKQMKQDYIAELTAEGRVAVANVVLTKFMKLRQITSGFVIDDDEQAFVVPGPNPKLNTLLEIIEECGTEQMIIWCQFHYEMDLIYRSIKEIGPVSQLHGRVKLSDRDWELEKFLTAKSRFLIAHPDSAGHGLTLTNCHIAVFFSLDYSMENYSQARGRIYRKGQKNNCLYIHLITRDTIDADVLAIVQKKETAQDLIARYLK